MKPVCIVDTCSLINLSDVQLARRSLHSWLWDEFEVRYSKAVLKEIEDNKGKMGSGEIGESTYGPIVL